MIDSELLAGIPCLADAPRSALEDLARVAREVDCAAGERIVPLIKPPQQVLFILTGLAKLVAVSPSGVERIIYVFRPGEVIGSRVLLEESREAADEIVAMHPVRALTVSRHDFLSISEAHPEILMSVTREFTRRLEGLTSRMLAAMSEDVPVRLGQLLLDFASQGATGHEDFVPLTYPLTHEAMAQIIGASRPHTSTVLRDLEEIGLVRRRSERGLLVRPAGMARMLRGVSTPA
jgi:CRP-like cAMP-binding protein